MVPVIAGVVGTVLAPRYLIWNSVFPSSGTISNAMANQEGWSWEESPKLVSHKKFRMIQDAFLSRY